MNSEDTNNYEKEKDNKNYKTEKMFNNEKYEDRLKNIDKSYKILQNIEKILNNICNSKTIDDMLKIINEKKDDPKHREPTEKNKSGNVPCGVYFCNYDNNDDIKFLYETIKKIIKFDLNLNLMEGHTEYNRSKKIIHTLSMCYDLYTHIKIFQNYLNLCKYNIENELNHIHVPDDISYLEDKVYGGYYNADNIQHFKDSEILNSGKFNEKYWEHYDEIYLIKMSNKNCVSYQCNNVKKVDGFAFIHSKPDRGNKWNIFPCEIGNCILIRDNDIENAKSIHDIKNKYLKNIFQIKNLVEDMTTIIMLYMEMILFQKWQIFIMN